jgi:SAM-dependent methyltransferase
MSARDEGPRPQARHAPGGEPPRAVVSVDACAPRGRPGRAPVSRADAVQARSDARPSRAAAHEARRAWRELHRTACRPYRDVGRFAWHFARGKLAGDPVFRALLQSGELPPHARVLDIGCGQGLLASLLAAAEALHARGAWPAAWGDAPVGVRYTGIELMARDVARAEQAAAHLGGKPRFTQADMCHAALPASDVVVVLDVLHYVDIAAQDAVLARVRDALRPHGRLLLRVGDAADTRRFAASQWVDRIVTLTRGHRTAPVFGRPLQDWIATLQRLDFKVRSEPMSRGTPFANVLLVADLAAGA